MQPLSNFRSVVLFGPGTHSGDEKIILNGHRVLEQRNLSVSLWIIQDRREPKVIQRFEQLASITKVNYSSYICKHLFDFKLFIDLKRNLKLVNPQVVHAHGLKAAVYAFLSKPKGTKLVVTHHGKAGHIDGLILKHANAVIASSADTKKDLSQFGIENKKLFLVEDFLTSNELGELMKSYSEDEAKASFATKSKQQEVLLRFAPETWAIRTLKTYKEVVGQA